MRGWRPLALDELRKMCHRRITILINLVVNKLVAGEASSNRRLLQRKPWVFQGSLGRYALFRVNTKHLLEQVLHKGRVTLQLIVDVLNIALFIHEH